LESFDLLREFALYAFLNIFAKIFRKVLDLGFQSYIIGTVN